MKNKFEYKNDGSVLINAVSDASGNPIVLTPQEAASCRYWEGVIKNSMGAQFKNDLGYQIDITTLTAISKRISQQKFAGIPFADYMPVVVGEGAWATSILKYRTFSVGDSFDSGVIDTAANHSQFASANTGVDGVTVPIKNWGMQIDYTIFQLQEASRSGSWDLIESLERSRRTNWDLGIQRTSFLGLTGDTRIKGMLTLGDVTANSSLITKYISSMTAEEFSTFVQGVVDAYRTNAQFTAYPTHFILPELDYNGLAAPVSATYPNISKLSYLLDTFKTVTRNPNFKILPCFYADKVNNTTVSGLNKNRYVLANYDQDSFNLNIPVQYTTTQQNTFNGAQWQNVGYGQFTGVTAYRPRELLYFDFS